MQLCCFEDVTGSCLQTLVKNVFVRIHEEVDCSEDNLFISC